MRTGRLLAALALSALTVCGCSEWKENREKERKIAACLDGKLNGQRCSVSYGSSGLSVTFRRPGLDKYEGFFLCSGVDPSEPCQDEYTAWHEESTTVLIPIYNGQSMSLMPMVQTDTITERRLTGSAVAAMQDPRLPVLRECLWDVLLQVQAKP